MTTYSYHFEDGDAIIDLGITGDPAAGWAVDGNVRIAGRTWNLSGQGIETTPAPPVDPPVDPPIEPPVEPPPVPGPTPLPPATGPLTNMVMGPMELYPQPNKITFIWPFTGDDGIESHCYAQFRETGALQWRQAVGLEEPMRGEFARVQRQAERFFAGCLLDLKPGTSYDVWLDVRKNGEAEPPLLFHAWTADDPPDRATLQPTHYVRAGGDDTADGLTPATAWGTLDKARTAPDGAAVEVGVGWHVRPTGPFSGRVALLGANPCLDANRQPIPSFASVVYSGVQTSPVARQWQPYGPASDDIWVWDTGRTGLKIAGYHVGLDDCPTRLGYWEQSGRPYPLAAWVTAVTTCDAYPAGMTVSGTRAYVRLPRNAPLGTDPNAYWMTFGSNGPVLAFAADDSRASDLVLIGGVHAVNVQSADRVVIDGCITRLAKEHVKPDGGSSLTIVQNCRVEERGFYNRDFSRVDPSVIPWGGVKVRLTAQNGAVSLGGKPLVSCEISGFVGRMSRLPVIRDCTFSGLFNGVSSYNINLDRYAALGLHVYRCTLENIADDSFEPEYSLVGGAYHDNRTDHVLTSLSVAPLHYGPLYVYRNHFGPHVKQPQIIPPGGLAMGSPVGIKDSGKSGGPNVARPTIWLVNNTIDCTAQPNVSTWEQYDGVGASAEPRWICWNNVFMGSRYAAAVPPTQRVLSAWAGNARALVRDFNHFYTSDLIRGNKVNTTNYPTWPAYLTAVKGLDQHSNLDLTGMLLEFHDPFSPDQLAPGVPVGNVVETYGPTPRKGAQP